MNSSNDATEPDDFDFGAVITELDDHELKSLIFDWPLWAHDAQLPPPGEWTTWLMIGGRGAGKTRAGAEWVRSLAEAGVTPIALVGQTMTEAIAVMVRGESGLLNVHPPEERPVLKERRLIWPNGVEAMVLAADNPEGFRGPQFAAAWSDEVGKWRKAEAAWDNLQFTLRLGDQPRQMATTTPRPTRLLRRLLADKQSAVTRMKTAQNRHLARGFLKAIVARYRGTVLGRQELDGELIEDLPGALWQRAMFRRPDQLAAERIVVAVDPPVTGHARSDACGIIVAGRQGEGAVVLQDCSFKPNKPLEWAHRAVAAFHAHQADAIIAEVNQGGDLVKAIIAQADATVPVRSVHANRGKWLRAEPVAALYGRGLVAHVEGLTALEDEMCSLGPDGKSEGHSPDRVDALVWAVTELLLNGDGPRVRGL